MHAILANYLAGWPVDGSDYAIQGCADQNCPLPFAPLASEKRAQPWGTQAVDSVPQPSRLLNVQSLIPLQGMKEFSVLPPHVPSLHGCFIGDDNSEQGDAVSSQ